MGRLHPTKCGILRRSSEKSKFYSLTLKLVRLRIFQTLKAKAELLEEVDVRFKCCHYLYENTMRDGFGCDPNVENAEAELNAEDSTPELQLIKMTQCSNKLSTASVKNLLRKIELERQRAKISATRKRDLAKVKAAADAAEAAKAKAKADAEVADAEANFGSRKPGSRLKKKF